MTNGQKVVETARKEIGTKESPENTNKTKYGEWFGFNGVHWCAIFVSWAYHHAGVPLGNIGFLKGMAGCPVGVKHFTETKEVTTSPQEGDIVFFDWNGDKKHDHTGIFVRWIDDNTFETIEGNTGMLNQSNGGEVMLRTRTNKNVIFVHPKVLDAPDLSSGFPRRSILSKNTPAELTIYNAIQEVEKVGADVKLTEAVILLGKAKDLVSDFVDKK